MLAAVAKADRMSTKVSIEMRENWHCGGPHSIVIDSIHRVILQLFISPPVNTKVDLRFQLDSANWLPPLAKKCLREQVNIE